MQEHTNTNNSSGRWSRLFPIEKRASFLRGALIIFVIGFSLGAVAWGTCGFNGCPNVDKLTSYQPSGASVLLDRQGKPFADLAPVKREIIHLKLIPKYVPQIFLAVEDKRFEKHSGIDWRRVLGAIGANLKAGSFEEGFSTITMQLARSVFPEKIDRQHRTISRKLVEIRVAGKIESKFNKAEILELYLNHVYFGNGVHGIEAASQYYFRRSAKQLTIPQTALLAGLLKAPSHYDPRQRPEAARKRRNLVLQLAAEQARISPQQAAEGKKSTLGVYASPPQRKQSAGIAPYFVEAVRRELEQLFGDRIYSDPVRVLTTLDVRAQRAADEELDRQLKAVEQGLSGRYRGGRYSAASEAGEEGTSYLQGALVMLKADTGDVLAWVGGRNFNHSQYDRVMLAQRQAGSAFKPFVYAAALERGYALSQILIDEPLQVQISRNKTWQPKNFAGDYESRITTRDALVRSKNVATVRLANEVGYSTIVDMARQSGLKGDMPNHPSMPLGTVTVSPLELTSAYTEFASMGYRATPRLILKVMTGNGEVVWESKPETKKVLDSGIAFLLTDVMRDVVDRGTGVAVRQVGFRGPAAGKTGTSNKGTDAWFVGFTPEVVAGIWIGFDQPQPIASRAAGGALSAPVWGRLMARYYQGRPMPATWQPPSSVVQRLVDPLTGLILASGCIPLTGTAYQEYFLSDKEPAKYCPGQEGIPENAFVMRSAALEMLRNSGQADELARLRSEEEAMLLQDQAASDWPDEELDPAFQPMEPNPSEPPASDDQLDSTTPQPGTAPMPPLKERQPLEPKAPDDQVNSIAPQTNLSGSWEVINHIQNTSHSASQGTNVGYRVFLSQNGNRITGQGRKVSQNGQSLPPPQQTRLTINGTTDGSNVRISFIEYGNKHASNGFFRWNVAPKGDSINGEFSNSAADTSGNSSARRALN